MDTYIRGISLPSSSFLELLCANCSITYVIDFTCCKVQFILGNVCRTIVEWSSAEAKRDKAKINDFLRKAYGMGCVTLEILPCPSNPCNQASIAQGIVDSCIDPKIDELKQCLYKAIVDKLNGEDCSNGGGEVIPPPQPPRPPTVYSYGGGGNCC
jgi:hypothetical protein